VLQVDEGPVGGEDADSALDVDGANSTASLTSSILEYRTHHGRTYHNQRGTAQSWYVESPGSQWSAVNGASRTPNDEKQMDSMDIK